MAHRTLSLSLDRDQYCLLALLSCLLTLFPMANAVSEAESDVLFQSPGPLSAELALPLNTLLRNKADKPTVRGTLTVDGVAFGVEVTPRGKSRLEKCSFPPLWLAFDKAQVKDTLLHKQKRLKLVTHCKRNLTSKGYLAAEMLAYRLFNLLTPYSYQVRAVTMHYVDSEGGKLQTQPAFLLEHKKRLGKRLALEEIEAAKVPRKALAADYTALAALYNYFLGNTDFSFVRGPSEDECCHNSVPMRDGSGAVYPLLYDFDSSGFVDPPYAVPAESLGLRRLTQRKFRGYCAHNAETTAARQQFIAHKDEVLSLVENFDEIPGLNRKKTLGFVSKFYATLEDDKSFERRILKRCRG
ncbi:MAG: hypothetical protein RIC89_11345 [Pseudomonadales bacterium]